MAMTGIKEVNPIKFGAPAIDYATGTMGAFALALITAQGDAAAPAPAAVPAK